jgi:hypothetical protein
MRAYTFTKSYNVTEKWSHALSHVNRSMYSIMKWPSGHHAALICGREVSANLTSYRNERVKTQNKCKTRQAGIYVITSTEWMNVTKTSGISSAIHVTLENNKKGMPTLSWGAILNTASSQNITKIILLANGHTCCEWSSGSAQQRYQHVKGNIAKDCSSIKDDIHPSCSYAPCTKRNV